MKMTSTRMGSERNTSTNASMAQLKIGLFRVRMIAMIGAMVTDSTAEQIKISSVFSSPPSRMGHVSTMSSLLKNIMPSISHCAPEYR